MASGIPAEKATQLLEQIWSLTSEDLRNELVIAGIRREIEKYKAVNRARAFAISGELNFKLGDVASARNEYETSFRNDNYDDVAIYNYALGLMRYGLLNEAYPHMQKSFELTKSIKSLKGLIDLNASCLRFESTCSLYEQYFKMEPQHNNDNNHEGLSIDQLHNIIISLKDRMLENELSDDLCASYADLFWGVFARYANNNPKLEDRTFSLRALNSGRCEVKVNVPGTPAEIAEMNMELSKELATTDLDNKITRFFVSGFSVQ